MTAPEKVAGSGEIAAEPAEAASWAEAEAALSPAGIAFAKTVRAASVDEVTAASGQVGLPLVLKLDSDQSLHRSEIGGVRVGLESAQDAVAAYRDFERAWGPCCPVLVQEMVVRPSVEALLSARRLPDLGVVVTIGSGGTEAELRNDVVTAVAPVGEDYLRELIRETQLGTVLSGYREGPRYDLDALAGAAHRLMELLRSDCEIEEVEINPVLVFEQGQGLSAVDVILRRVKNRP